MIFLLIILNVVIKPLNQKKETVEKLRRNSYWTIFSLPKWFINRKTKYEGNEH